MLKKQLVTGLALLLLVGNVVAKDDCDDPVNQWQSQEKLRRMIENNGWKIRRIKVDDGCYEVYGRDRLGNHFEAKYSPATLKIRSLEIEFRGNHHDAADYLDGNYLPDGGTPPAGKSNRHRLGKSGDQSTEPRE